MQMILVLVRLYVENSISWLVKSNPTYNTSTVDTHSPIGAYCFGSEVESQLLDLGYNIKYKIAEPMLDSGNLSYFLTIPFRLGELYNSNYMSTTDYDQSVLTEIVYHATLYDSTVIV